MDYYKELYKAMLEYERLKETQRVAREERIREREEFESRLINDPTLSNRARRLLILANIQTRVTNIANKT